GGDVVRKLSQAVLDLWTVPIEESDFVERRPVLTDVADETGLAVDVRLVAHDVGQELTGSTDEGAPVILFVFAWSLADHGDPIIDALDYDRVLVGNEPGGIGDHLILPSAFQKSRHFAGESYGGGAASRFHKTMPSQLKLNVAIHRV